MYPLLLLIYYASLMGGTIAGILYPRESESRDVKSLDGIWNFRLSPPQDALLAYNQKWYMQELKDSGSTIPMPVPASYNDITMDKNIRDHVGLVWYDRKFFVPNSWSKNQRVCIRFGSVRYAARVWINGQLVLSHEIGHLPFKADVTTFLKFGQENLITVVVDNFLTFATVPQGLVEQLNINNKTFVRQKYSFDFFNYAGIDRPVLLYTTPELYIDDITVKTSISHGNGIVEYQVYYEDRNQGAEVSANCFVTLSDREGNEINKMDKCNGTFIVPNAKFWWPYLMHPEPGYLYMLKVELSDTNNTMKDVYRLPVGIRQITWKGPQIFINHKPIYVRGVGKHEDFYIKGKGLDLSVMVRDYDLLKWVGVNTFRTSHYPYSEEIMDMADSLGIMVIDECPSVNTEDFSHTLLQKHKASLSELYDRDKNRPSVIMWSLANEPRSHEPEADPYFKEVATHVRTLDSTRPITIVISRKPKEDRVGQYIDVICFNRYNAWYSHTGITEIIYQNVVSEAENWFIKHNKPVIMSEYGADTLAGMHILPGSVWSEEYQLEVMEEHFKAFDDLRRKGFFIGEMIWNFADFQTAQTTGRAGGNKKGVFTREREPKASAFLLRERYQKLAYELDGVPVPKDLERYTSPVNTTNSGK